MSHDRHPGQKLLRVILCLYIAAALIMPAGLTWAVYGDNEEIKTEVSGESTGGTGGVTAGETGQDQTGNDGTAPAGQDIGGSGSTGDGAGPQQDQSGSPAQEEAKPAEGTPAGETAPSEQEAVQEEEVPEEPPEPSTAYRFKINGIDITFKTRVRNDEFLDNSYYTSFLKTTGNKKSIKLTWPAVKNKSSISGYYIIRRDQNGGRWRHIATVGRNATSYTDKAAKAKNKGYYYTLVAYQKKDGYIKISKASPWAAAVTSKSKKKKNVYSVSFSRPAKSTVIAAGQTTSIPLSFPSKAFSRQMRWSSSNNAIATVTNNGYVTAISPGTVTLYARTHTGRIVSTKMKVIEPGTVDGMLAVMQSWLGYSKRSGKHKGIIDIYNSEKPLPVGYTMNYRDAWCDATITAAAIRSGNVDAVGRECSVDRHINIFKSKGIWEEDGTIVPSRGDIVVYNWRKSTQPNDTHASHIGIVESVSGNTITVIEGNRGLGVVARRTIPVGWGYIRGYGRPHYGEEPEPEEPEEAASEETAEE